jgi:FAD-dependent oxidoreductase domain-containing protein 1
VAANDRYDVVLIGAGIIGSSLAMGLAQRGIRVAVADIDLSGRLSSSEKNAGGVRATWWQPVNVTLCRESIRYYESIRDEVGFRQKGYLWLYDAATWPKACEHLEMQRALGHPIEALTPAEVNRRVPEIDRLEGLAGATWSPADGLINPNLLKQHYRARAIAGGAKFLDRVYFKAASVSTGEVRLQCAQADAPLTDEALARLMTDDDGAGDPPGRPFELRAHSVVITTGAWSDNALALFGLESYSEPLRRQICLVDNRSANFAAYGMIVDTSGVYFHNEGAHILAGYSPPDTPPGRHFEYDGEPYFLDEIWPRMYSRMSCCERMRHAGGWAGLYEVSPDRSAIVGQAAPQVYEAHSFSGRGVMQSYGAGQALSELIADGRYRKFDAGALCRERFARRQPAREELHI